MRTTFNISFYCRPCKRDRKGLAPVEISLIVNGKRTFINLPRKEYPAVFKKETSQKKTNPTKEYLEEVRRKFNIIQTELLRNDIPITPDSLKEYFKNGGIRQTTLQDLSDEYLALLRKRVPSTLTYSAYKKYQNAFDCLMKFIPGTTTLKQIRPSDLESAVVGMSGRYKPTTVNGIATKCNTLFVYAHDNGRTPQILRLKHLKSYRQEIKYLTEQQLERIINLKIDNKSLSDVRDAFILQASTGLCYSDVYTLKKDDVQIMDDGTHLIQRQRAKTGITYTTVVLPFGVEVLKKHNYQLRIISNQKYNLFLKTINQLTGIEIPLTTHLARKTFATLLLNRGVRIEVVSRTLGHSSTKMTETYYSKMLKTTIVNEINQKVNF